MAILDPTRVRKFGGRLFIAHRPMKSKRDALSVAKQFRYSGYLSRITKGADGYTVWTTER